MVPSLRPGDLILVCKVAARRTAHRAGAIVVIHHRGREVIKRVVRVLADGTIWVEGDNKARSLDSRTFGPKMSTDVRSWAVAVIWPPNRWGGL